MTTEAEREAMLSAAQIFAPETETVMTDGHGNWFGARARAGSGLSIPTTNLVGPDGDAEFERWED